MRRLVPTTLSPFVDPRVNLGRLLSGLGRLDDERFRKIHILITTKQ
jgi:hypothetical protein